jgi:NAD(P)H-hydrate epimerase
MKIFKAEQVKEIDAYTIEHEPIPSIDLMERAARQLYSWIIERYKQDKNFRIIVGPGNNGGDGLALARMLADDYFHVDLYYIKFTEKVTEDWKINHDRLLDQRKVNMHILEKGEKLPDFPEHDILVDGLFGSGLSRPLEGFPAAIVNQINESENEVIAIDIPSGLMGEDNSGNKRENIVRADITLTFQFPNLAFFFAENAEHVGEWFILPIGLHPEKIGNLATENYFVTREFIARQLIVRKKFSHKGSFGHVLLISGCYGKMGAAVLGSRAALRTGTGLLTTHVPKFGSQIIQTALPEAMISIDQSDILFTEVPDLEPYQAVGVGPAIGCRDNSQKALLNLLEKTTVPLVIDADAINILGEHKEWLKNLPPNTVLTPHPKEFERLVGKTADHYERHEKQVDFSKKHNVTIALKGAHTAVSCPDGTAYFNTTGNPGMATAGSGDVLTGVILSLLGQGYTSEMAAITGVYVHGLAGDIARDNVGEEAVIATDIIENLGNAFNEIREYE